MFERSHRLRVLAPRARPTGTVITRSTDSSVRVVALVVIAFLGAACSGGHRAAPTTTSTPSNGSSTTTDTIVIRPTTTVPPTTTTTRPAPTALACVAAMPLRQRVAQMVMAPVPVSPDGEVQAFATRGLGGALLESATGVDAASVARLRDGGRIPLFIAVDEEGGTAQRLASLTGVLPPARTVAASMTVSAAQAMIGAHARRVAALGVNVVFAPVVDVLAPSGVAPIGSRSFGSDPAVVTGYGRAYVAGWQGAGVMPVLKHFPGFGSASANTDVGPAVTPPLSQLEGRDLVPYEALARDTSAVGVMVSHVQVPGLANGPASLAAATYLLLRQSVRFAGVTFTDSLDAAAIVDRESVPDAAVDAIAAGADEVVLTLPGQSSAVIAAVTQAVGTKIAPAQVDASVLRILAAKRVDPCGGFSAVP